MISDKLFTKATKLLRDAENLFSRIPELEAMQKVISSLEKVAHRLELSQEEELGERVWTVVKNLQEMAGYLATSPQSNTLAGSLSRWNKSALPLTTWVGLGDLVIPGVQKTRDMLVDAYRGDEE